MYETAFPSIDYPAGSRPGAEPGRSSRGAPRRSSPRSAASAALAALAAVLLTSALGACAGRQQIDDLTVRVENLEEQQRRLADMEERLARIEDQSQRLLVLNETLAGQLAQVNEISEALAKLERAGDRPRRPRRPRGPDPEAVYAVPVDGSPTEGPGDAKVTIVKAFEFACRFCERSRHTLAQIRRRYGQDVRIVYKHFIVHPSTATLPARAACAAHSQDKFSAMKEAIWERGYKAGRDFSRENMLRLARRMKLDMGRFKRDLEGDCVGRVRHDHQEMAKLGVTGTPGFFINGRFLRGAQPFPAFQALIDEELAKANEVIRTKGIGKADYYEYVVANGRTSN